MGSECKMSSRLIPFDAWRELQEHIQTKMQTYKHIYIHCFAGNWIGCFALLVLGADPLFCFDRFKTRLLQLRCESAGNDDNLFLGGTFQLS